MCMMRGVEDANKILIFREIILIFRVIIIL